MCRWKMQENWPGSFPMTDFAIIAIEISGFVVSVRYPYSICRNGTLDKVIVTNFYDNI